MPVTASNAATTKIAVLRNGEQAGMVVPPGRSSLPRAAARRPGPLMNVSSRLKRLFVYRLRHYRFDHESSRFEQYPVSERENFLTKRQVLGRRERPSERCVGLALRVIVVFSNPRPFRSLVTSESGIRPAACKCCVDPVR